jgi:tyrosine-protein kinase Etk/Wzc
MNNLIIDTNEQVRQERNQEPSGVPNSPADLRDKQQKKIPDRTAQRTLAQNTQEEVARLRREMLLLKQDRSILQFGLPSGFSSPGISPGEFFATFIESWRLIAGIVLAFALLSSGYILISEPVYRVDALVETGVHMNLLSDIFKDSKDETAVNENIEILKSRKILGKVVDDLKLDIVTKPVYFPLVGAAIAHINNKLKTWTDSSFQLGLPWLDITGYAWDNEQLEIETFDVPSAYLGKSFTLVTKENNQYQLLDEEDNPLTEGAVGTLNANWLPGEGQSNILVSSIKRTAPDMRFKLSKMSQVDAINQLILSLSVLEKGLGSGVMEVSMEGAQKDKITKIINDIVETFVQQDRAKKADKIGISIDFMEKQIPELQEKIAKAEQELNSFRQKHSTVDLSKETQIILERMVAIEAELSDFRRKRAELLYQFTPQHSKMLSIDAHIGALNKELAALENKAKSFPSTEQEMLHLSKDAELYTELYTFLRNRIGQLRVVQEAPDGYVGVVDFATPSQEPVKPQKLVIMAISLTLGIFLGIAAAFLRKALRSAVNDPEIIEKKLGLPVYATVPHSSKQRKLLKATDKKKPVLAIEQPLDPAIESLRSLRTSFHFVLLEAKNNVILITGPTPGIGKSFLTVNFGAVLASTGKRVLLIDADLRKGHLNKYFDMDNMEGLSDIIANGKPVEHVIRETQTDGLDIICAGTTPPNPSELLLHERFATAVEKLSQLYDYVIIDSAPVLLVTDPTIIGRLTGTALLVVKAGEHTLREIEHSVKRLEQGGVNLRGFVFNDMPISKSRYGYGDYYGYAYDYSYKSDA